MLIGVLGVQGDFREHRFMLERLGIPSKIVRTSEELNQVDGLIIAGGESTTMIRIMKRVGLFDYLKEKIKNGLPVYGTCAGMILLAAHVENYPQESLGAIDIHVVRNAYGRQVDSFVESVEVKGLDSPFEAIFIRAPKVVKWKDDVHVLSELEGTPVMLRQDNVLVSSFHPELTGDPRIHDYFVNMVKGA